MSKILAIDLGTTLFKFSLFERDGQLIATCRIPPPVISDYVLMEIPANAFVDTIVQGISELKKTTEQSLDDVEAITFATQTNSFVLLNPANRPLIPIILWPDRRAIKIEREIKRRCDIPDLPTATGVPNLSHQFMVAKLLWLQNHVPDLWGKSSKLCLISDYLTLIMTGRYVTEAGASGLTGLMDIHRCRWLPEMLARFKIPEIYLPMIVRAGADVGPISPDAAARFGLPKTCRFIVGCLDQYAGAIGAGNIAPGMISETTGTVLATVRFTDQFAGDTSSDVFQGPSFRPEHYWQMTFGDVSANYLQWYRDHLSDQPDFDQLTALAEPIAPGAEGLRLNTSVPRTNPQEVFLNRTPQHTRGHEVRCILEAVAVALRDQIATLTADTIPQEVRCTGGAACSNLWLQIKADVLNARTVATTCPEPTSLGAAMLAEATLANRDLPGVAKDWVRLMPPHIPDAQRHEQYAALFANH